MIYVTRKETFNAAHKLYHPGWSEEKNIEIFGKCANPNWHGHNYSLYVTVKGEPQADTGYVIDLKQLSTLIKKTVIDDLDHKNINIDVPWMKDKMASTEILAIEIWTRLVKQIEGWGCKLHCVKLMETENNYVEYFGD